MTEKDDLLHALRERRDFLRFTVREISEADATRRTTASELSLGGLVKHLAGVEESWMRFVQQTRRDQPPSGDWSDEFRLLPGETLAGALDNYDQVAKRTDDIIATIDLDTAYELPEAPWRPAGIWWTNRRVVLHLIGETAQHAGHADILRESIDGQKTMG